MRGLQIALAMGLVALFAGHVDAADGQVSSAMMAQLGLGGTQVVSDSDGEQIRGAWMVYGPGAKAAISKLVAPAGPKTVLIVNQALFDANVAVFNVSGISGNPVNGNFWLLP